MEESMVGLKEDAKAESLEILFRLLNTDIQSKRSSHFVSLVVDYTKWLAIHASKYPVFDFKLRYNLYSEEILDDLPVIIHPEKKALFVELLDHLRSKIEQIISDAADSSAAPIIEINGTLKVRVDGESKIFVEEFQPEEMDLNSGLTLEQEKLLADLVFSEMIREFDLKPDRFRRCKRCKKYFYQSTEKIKDFCSTKCGNAFRQAKWVKSQKKGKTKTRKKKKAS